MKPHIYLPDDLEKLCKEHGITPSGRKMTIKQHMGSLAAKFHNAGKTLPPDLVNYKCKKSEFPVCSRKYRGKSKKREVKRVVCSVGTNPPAPSEAVEPQTAWALHDGWDTFEIPEWTR